MALSRNVLEVQCAMIKAELEGDFSPGSFLYYFVCLGGEGCHNKMD